MTGRSFARHLAVVAAAGIASAPAASVDAHLRAMGTEAYTSFWLDTDSLRRDGDLLLLRELWQRDFDGAKGAALVVVDCKARRRSQLDTALDDGRPLRDIAAGATMRDVFPGTRQATEFAYACAQHPKPAHDAATGAPSAVGTGLVVSADGLVVAAKSQFGRCARITATLADKTWRAVPARVDPLDNLMLLRLPLLAWAPMPPRTTAGKTNEPVTLVGELGTALGAAAGNLEMPAGAQPGEHLRVGVLASTTMQDGPIFDAGGAVLGFAVGPSGTPDGFRRRLEVLPAALLADAVRLQGGDWAAEPAQAPSLDMTMQHAVAVTVRLACHDGR